MRCGRMCASSAATPLLPVAWVVWSERTWTLSEHTRQSGAKSAAVVFSAALSGGTRATVFLAALPLVVFSGQFRFLKDGVREDADLQKRVRWSSLLRPRNIPQQRAAPRIPCFQRDGSTIALAFASLLGARNCDPCSSRMNPKIARPFNRAQASEAKV